MFTKTVTPIIVQSSVDPSRKICSGAITEYRLFGLLLAKKTYWLPSKYGLEFYEMPPI